MQNKHRPAYLFQVHHHAPRNVHAYGELTIVVRDGSERAYNVPTLRITYQSDGNKPDAWYGFRYSLEGSDSFTDLSAGLDLLRRFHKAMGDASTRDAATVLTALESFATEAAYSEVEGRNVPLQDLPKPGTKVWMDKGADLYRMDYCTVHVQAETMEEAQARVLKELGARYPDRIVHWHNNGRQVEHIKTQPAAPLPWRALLVKFETVAV